jgi:hypothetical protein
MVGELFETFCERSIGDALRAFELWAYPDGTLNLVVVSDGVDGKFEACFPCAVHTLQSVLDGRRTSLENENSSLRLRLCDDFVTAEATCEGHSWHQGIDAAGLQDALDRVNFSPLR